MNNVTLELTSAEVSAIRQMLHVAVQARGLEVAEVAVVLNKKLAAAMQAALDKAKTDEPTP